MKERALSLIMSKWSPGPGPRWSGEWSGLMSSRKYSTIIIMPWEAGARPGIISGRGKKKEKSLLSCFDRKGRERKAQRERERERERSEEQRRRRTRRGGGAQFRQEIPAEKVGPRPNYTALCQRLYTNAHEHAYTHTHTRTHTHTHSQLHTQTLICSAVSLSVSNHQERLRQTQTCYFEVEQKCLS